MKNSPRNKDDVSQSLTPSPNSSIITVTRVTSANRPYTTRSETATVCANSSSFREIVQLLTGPSMSRYPAHLPAPSLRYLLPPLRTVPTKKHSSSSSTTIYERRNHLKINPVRSGLTGNVPSLVLGSPDTPLLHDPFSRPGSVTPSPSASESGDSDVEEREIREKGFYLHPSPSSTPTDPKPELLVLFPLTSPRASSDAPASST